MPRDNRATDRVEYLTAFRPLREDETSNKDTASKDAERVAREIDRRKQEGR
jgi:type I restriction enzyme, S subunit